jgi:hypothetical protein
MHTTYIIFFFIILFPRLGFIFLFPEAGGDYEIYTTVAKNILNGCGVSLSTPLTDDCVPHFGGNHGPGYPFFLSVVWSIFNYSDNAVRIIQSIIYSGVCIYFLHSAYELTKNKKIILYLLFILALSPLLVAWPRYVQTETLSIAASIYLLSELVLSLSKNKIRIISVALALVFATWIRLDNIFLTVPVAVTVIYIHGFKNGVIKGSLIACLLATTWGVWTIRNIAVDLPTLIPTDMIMPDGSRSPSGYLKWTKTWITHEYERPGALWGINRKNYNNITIPDRAYMSAEEKLEIESLIGQLQKYNQKDFPKSIDKEFENIANNKIKNYPIQHWLVYPLTRSIRMWINPFSSFGWPNEMPDSGLSKEERLSAAKGNSNILIQKAIEFPMHASSKAFNAFYRLILMMLFILSIIIIYSKRKNTHLLPISLITMSYILSRTIFFSFNSNFETRYMVTTIPFIELLVILTFIPIIYKMK